jgi:hypothetical protein
MLRRGLAPIAPLVVLAAVGCTAPSLTPGPPGPAGRATGGDGATLRPATLEYAGRHEGEHPTWRYRESVTVEAGSRGGRAVWRRTARYVDDDSVTSAIELDAESLAPVHLDLMWNGIQQRAEFAGGEMTGAIVERGVERPIRAAYGRAILVDALDVYLAALPLAPGYRGEVELFDFWLISEPTHVQTRRFVVRVERAEPVSVPAGTLPALLVAIEPTDGDQRNAGRFHVAASAPHYAIRMQYVVNPVTVGDEKRSIGTDELVRATIARGNMTQ